MTSHDFFYFSNEPSKTTKIGQNVTTANKLNLNLLQLSYKFSSAETSQKQYVNT